MKTLIYGMQSSGASLFTYWLAQQPDTVAVVDLYSSQPAPFIDRPNTILKATVNTKFHFDDQYAAFRPDVVIAFVRNPVENLIRLSEKSYVNLNGSPIDKLMAMDTFLQSGRYDFLVKYEDFILKKDIGLGKKEFYKFERSIQDVVDFACLHDKWCNANYRKKWGTGNIHGNNLKALDISCPNILKLYGA